MQYDPLSIKKQPFLVTPEELRDLLAGFHHVITTTGVKRGYVESDPNEFFIRYKDLYQKLKDGEKLVWKKDYQIADLSIGVTQHLENCLYKTTSRLSVPNFREPCPCLETFIFTPWKNQLCTTFAVMQAPENICGLCLSFPAKIEYPAPNDKHGQGIVLNTELDDYESWQYLLTKIKSITKPLTLELNGRVHRTAVRVSTEAHKDLRNFYFITSNGIVLT